MESVSKTKCIERKRDRGGRGKEGRKCYLTTHSTILFYSYLASIEIGRQTDRYRQTDIHYKAKHNAYNIQIKYFCCLTVWLKLGPGDFKITIINNNNF